MLDITKTYPKREENIMSSFIQSIRILHMAIAVTVLFIGCAPLATDYRKQGFASINKGFAKLPDSPDLYEEIVIDRLKIIIVGSREQFKWTNARQAGSRISAYATTKNEIYIIGKQIGGKIVFDQAVLGHELNHILNYNNPIVVNPHQLDKFELCAIGYGKC
jgi:hypothetical protein